MKIIINKYHLKHGGHLYNAGDVVEVNDELAKRLVANSDGAFSFCHDGDVKPATPEKGDKSPANSGKNDKEPVLPTPDPTAAVKKK